MLSLSLASSQKANRLSAGEDGCPLMFSPAGDAFCELLVFAAQAAAGRPTVSFVGPPLVHPLLPERQTEKDDAASCHDQRTLRPFGRVPVSAPRLCFLSVLSQHVKPVPGSRPAHACEGNCESFSDVSRGLAADLVPSPTLSPGVSTRYRWRKYMAV